jgi:hypothetical protein
MWNKKVPINMGPKSVHKKLTIDKGRESHDCIVLVFFGQKCEV